MRVVFATIPHDQQEYPTVGDWRFDTIDGTRCLTVLVSDMGNPKYEALVMLHEFVEAMLCDWGGIDQNLVTAFDEAFEGLRGDDDTAEPGDDDDAPYHDQHQAATKLEKQFAKLADVKWKEYNDTVESL